MDTVITEITRVIKITKITLNRRRNRMSLDSVAIKKKDLHKLKKAYKHPWEKLRLVIENYYLNHQDEKPDSF